MHQSSTKSYRRSAVVLAALLFLCPASVVAIPLSQYQQNLQSAITALDTLSQTDEGESTNNYENRFNKTVEGVRSALPRNQTVESEGETYKVDNSWLHLALDELKNDVRRERIEQIIESLRALDARIDERKGVGSPGESKDAAKNKLESILARPEYASAVKGPNALMRLIRDFVAWFRNLFPKRRSVQTSSPEWLNLVAKILVGLAAVAVAVFLARLFAYRFKRSPRIRARKKREARIVLGERLEPEQTATDLLSEAEALARNGDLRAAIRKAYIALLVELGDRKIISLAQHKTNRDYLNALRELPPLHSRMRGLTDSFERHWYGFAEASQNDWQNFRDGYRAALRSGN